MTVATPTEQAFGCRRFSPPHPGPTRAPLRRLATRWFGDKQPEVIVGPDRRTLTVRVSKAAVGWTAGVVEKFQEK